MVVLILLSMKKNAFMWLFFYPDDQSQLFQFFSLKDPPNQDAVGVEAAIFLKMESEIRLDEWVFCKQWS